MTNTLLLLPSTAAPVPHRYLAGSAYAQPTPTVSAAFLRQTPIARRDIALCFAPAAADTPLTALA